LARNCSRSGPVWPAIAAWGDSCAQAPPAPIDKAVPSSSEAERAFRACRRPAPAAGREYVRGVDFMIMMSSNKLKVLSRPLGEDFVVKLGPLRVLVQYHRGVHELHGHLVQLGLGLLAGGDEIALQKYALAVGKQEVEEQQRGVRVRCTLGQ